MRTWILFVISVSFFSMSLSSCSNFNGPQIPSPLASSGTPSPQPIDTTEDTDITRTPIGQTTTQPPIFPSPTWTNSPSLSVVEGNSIFKSWFEFNPSCLFPCWANIIPGETSYSFAKAHISQVVDVYIMSPTIFEWNSRSRSFVNTNIRGFVISNGSGLVERMEIGVSEPIQSYQIDRILSVYGEPAEIFITVAPDMDTRYVFAELVLVYPDYRFLVSYLWLGIRNQEMTNVCYQTGESQGIIIEMGLRNWTKDMVIQIISNSPEELLIHYETFEDATGTSIAAFSEMLATGESTDCITMPLGLWGIK